MKNKNHFYLGISLLIFIILRIVYSYLNISDLSFLLKPSSMAVEIITGTNAIYDIAIGYFHPELDIIIDKSCSGYNFWLISFLMINFLLLKSNITKKWLVIPLSLIISYVLTILANVSRITGYIIIMNNDIPPLLDPNNTWLHQVEGIVVYLTFLVLFYFCLNYIINKKQNYEKAA